MVVIAVMFFIGIAAGGVLVVTYLRSWGRGVSDTEARLHQPGVHTVAYAVPPGRDPADLLAALRGAGYTAVEDAPDRLLVACPQDDDPPKVLRLLDETVRG